MDLIYSEIGRAAEYLFVSIFIYAAYDIALKSSETNKKVLFNGLLICAGIALVGGLSLGDPSCVEYEYGKQGHCYEYAEDGYEPTSNQIMANFAYLFTLLFVPTVFAVAKRKNFF